MGERYWYQSGITVFWIALGGMFVGLFVYNGYQQELENSKPTVIPDVTGYIEQPLLSSPSLVVTVWHEHTGVIRNGRLTVTVGGELVETQGGFNSQSYSFEVWQPNRDQAVALKFPLRHFDANREIPISFQFIGGNIKPYSYSDSWLGSTWKSNKK